MNENKQMIREQAYELWDHVRAGRMGRSDEFWFAARAEFERVRRRQGEGNLGAYVPPARGSVSS